MNPLHHKIDFVAIVSVSMANPNGDPLNGNRPRTNYSGVGEISDVCIKRKIRNRMQDMGHRIFVQSDDRCDDGCKSLSERATMVVGKIKDKDEYARVACEQWLDVRSFGQVFAFKDIEKSGVSVGVRGPVSIHQAISAERVEIRTIQITKSVNSETGEKRGSDTMGSKHMVHFGMYKIKGSINVQLAQKTGFSDEDAQCVKECLRTLFENDLSSARPDGSMRVVRLYWWEHDCALGQYPSAKVHGSIHVAHPDTVDPDADLTGYIVQDELPGLRCVVIDGQ